RRLRPRGPLRGRARRGGGGRGRLLGNVPRALGGGGPARPRGADPRLGAGPRRPRTGESVRRDPQRGDAAPPLDRSARGGLGARGRGERRGRGGRADRGRGRTEPPPGHHPGGGKRRAPRPAASGATQAKAGRTAGGAAMTFDPRHKSRTLTEGPDRAPARSMLRGIGFTPEDLARPLIGIASTWTETMPCNFHLRRLAEQVKQGIRAAGATPMEFDTIAISDGVTMGTEGMKASLVSREVI